MDTNCECKHNAGLYQPYPNHTISRRSAKWPFLPSTATTIIVNQAPPQADAGADFAVCNATSATLAGSDPGTFTGIWTQTAGPAGATIVNPNDPHTQVNNLVK